MRKQVLLFFFIAALTFDCSNGQPEKLEVTSTQNDLFHLETPVNSNPVEIPIDTTSTCECINNIFSQKKEKPLVVHQVGTTKIMVCGYRGEYGDGITLGEKFSDSSFYASGFEVFKCIDTAQVFEEGEYYLDKIQPEPSQLKIIRLMRMPQDARLEYKWTPVLTLTLKEKDDSILIDSSFALPTKMYTSEFLSYFKTEMERIKEDSNQILTYQSYLINYSFIQAVLNPKKYGKKLKSLGPFDGYLGPIYKDVLGYYSVYLKETNGG